jgi:putative ABC transport system permease protein
MRAGQAWLIARRNLAAHRRPAALSAFGVAIGVASFVFFVALGHGVSRFVREKLLPVDATTIEAKPAEVSLNLILGGGQLDDDAVARLRAIEAVADAFPKMALRIPSSTRFNGDFFGRPLRIYAEIMAEGVEPTLVAQDLADASAFADPGPGRPIPVLANDRILELYNKTFAPQRGLPRLSPAMLDGFQVPVAWGQSFIAGTVASAREGVLELRGFSRHALPLGVTMPLDAIRRINREQGKDADAYSSVLLRARRPDDVPAIAEAVRRMGFEVDDSERRLAEQVGFGIAVVTGTLALLSSLIAALAAVNISHAFYAAIRERRREIGILRAVGASRRAVLRILLLEAAILGSAGGLVGVAAGAGMALVVDRTAVRLLPDFPFKPDHFFAFPGWVFAAGMAIAWAAALIGALSPALTAARSEPVDALAE